MPCWEVAALVSLVLPLTLQSTIRFIGRKDKRYRCQWPTYESVLLFVSRASWTTLPSCRRRMRARRRLQCSSPIWLQKVGANASLRLRHGQNFDSDSAKNRRAVVNIICPFLEDCSGFAAFWRSRKISLQSRLQSQSLFVRLCNRPIAISICQIANTEYFDVFAIAIVICVVSPKTPHFNHHGGD